VLVDGVLGSRNGSNASLLSLLEAVARPPGCAGDSRKGIIASIAETPRLTRAMVNGRRTGARVMRGFLPDEAHGWTSQGESIARLSETVSGVLVVSDVRPSRAGREGDLAERVNPRVHRWQHRRTRGQR
jgi:hypothetical protein